MKFWKIGLAACALAVLTACGSSDNKELPPAELTDFTPEVSFTELWSRSIGDGQGKDYTRLLPAIDGNAIYAADAEGDVVAVDRLSGNTIWSQDLDTTLTGGVGVGGGLILVGASHGRVIALDQNTGVERWRARVSSEVLAPPASNGDVVIVQSLDDHIFGFKADTGEKLWMYEETPAVLTLRGTSIPVIYKDTVIAGLSTGKVIALDVARGVPAWEQRVAMPQGRSELDRIVDIDGAMELVNDVLYVVTYQGRVAALDADSGDVIWQREASSYAGVAQAQDTLFLSQADGTVEGVEERTASALWSNTILARRQLTGPALVSRYLVVGDFEGYMHALSQADGHLSGRTHVDSDGIRVHPLVKDGTLYVYSNGGTLAAYSLH